MNQMPNKEIAAMADELGMSSGRLSKMPEFFQGYLDRQKFSGLSLLVSREGQVVHQSHQGVMDFDSGKPIADDTIFRIYSMTKPITSVALMMLFEEGKFRLEHPLSRYLPEFSDMTVWGGGTVDSYREVKSEIPMRVVDILTHTSGLTYDFMVDHPLAFIYQKMGTAGARTSIKLDEFTRRLGDLPLRFEPGTSWHYSVGTDVCGRLIEVLSGQTLDKFFQERIFDPLGMSDTGFWVPEDKIDRFASCYNRDPKTGKTTLQDHPDQSKYIEGRGKEMLSGGGGLVSTIGDYHTFCKMLLNGGELNGVRLLSPRTIEFMTQNHLPGGQTMGEMGDALFSETGMDGNGFGLGFSVVLDPVANYTPVSQGAYSWGGAASTYFWIDPVEDIIGVLMTQIMPSNAYPIRPQFQQLVYTSIMD